MKPSIPVTIVGPASLLNINYESIKIRVDENFIKDGIKLCNKNNSYKYNSTIPACYTYSKDKIMLFKLEKLGTLLAINNAYGTFYALNDNFDDLVLLNSYINSVKMLGKQMLYQANQFQNYITIRFYCGFADSKNFRVKIRLEVILYNLMYQVMPIKSPQICSSSLNYHIYGNESTCDDTSKEIKYGYLYINPYSKISLLSHSSNVLHDEKNKIFGIWLYNVDSIDNPNVWLLSNFFSQRKHNQHNKETPFIILLISHKITGQQFFMCQPKLNQDSHEKYKLFVGQHECEFAKITSKIRPQTIDLKLNLAKNNGCTNDNSYQRYATIFAEAIDRLNMSMTCEPKICEEDMALSTPLQESNPNVDEIYGHFENNYEACFSQLPLKAGTNPQYSILNENVSFLSDISCYKPALPSSNNLLEAKATQYSCITTSSSNLVAHEDMFETTPNIRSKALVVTKSESMVVNLQKLDNHNLDAKEMASDPDNKNSRDPISQEKVRAVIEGARRLLVTTKQTAETGPKDILPSTLPNSTRNVERGGRHESPAQLDAILDRVREQSSQIAELREELSRLGGGGGEISHRRDDVGVNTGLSLFCAQPPARQLIARQVMDHVTTAVDRSPADQSSASGRHVTFHNERKQLIQIFEGHSNPSDPAEKPYVHRKDLTPKRSILRSQENFTECIITPQRSEMKKMVKQTWQVMQEKVVETQEDRATTDKSMLKAIAKKYLNDVKLTEDKENTICERNDIKQLSQERKTSPLAKRNLNRNNMNQSKRSSDFSIYGLGRSTNLTLDTKTYLEKHGLMLPSQLFPETLIFEPQNTENVGHKKLKEPTNSSNVLDVTKIRELPKLL